MDLQKLIQRLAIVRKDRDEAKKLQDELLTKFQQTSEWVSASTARAFASAEVESIESDIKDETYNDKRPHDAVQVKNFTVLEYNEQSARMWCFENFRPALKLDAKAFEGLQKTNALPDFVEVKTEARVQIATDLSKYLP